MAADDAKAPAGWFQDPEGPGLRYWDGGRWTEHRWTEHVPRREVASARKSAAASPSPSQRFNALPAADRAGLLIALAAIAGMVIGVFSPWAQAFLVTADGIESDGAPVLPCAVIAAGALWLYVGRPTAPRAALAAVLGVAAAATAIIGLGRIEDQSLGGLGSAFHVAEPAWGVYMTLVSSSALALAAGFLALRSGRSQTR